MMTDFAAFITSLVIRTLVCVYSSGSPKEGGQAWKSGCVREKQLIKKVQRGLERRRLREETVSGPDIRKMFSVAQEADTRARRCWL